MKLNALYAALGLALVLGSGSAAAFTLPPGDVGAGLAGALLEDDDIDWFHNNFGSADTIDVGDRLVAAVDITNIKDILAPFQPDQVIGPNKDALNAISDITVLSVTPLIDFNGNGVCDTGGATGDYCRWDFGPTTGGLLDNAAYKSAADEIPLVAFFTKGGDALNLTTCADEATCTGDVLDGTLWMSFGLGALSGEADGQWSTVNFANFVTISAVQALGASTKVTTIAYTLDLFVNNTGYDVREQNIDGCGTVHDCNGDGRIELVGSADILGGNGLTNGGFARSDADMTLLVPEPATLGLLGLGLLGMGAALRRRAA